MFNERFPSGEEQIPDEEGLPEEAEQETTLGEPRIEIERESDLEQMELLNSLIKRLDGLYTDLHRITKDSDRSIEGQLPWLQDMPAACSQLCMAAQTLLEERRNEIDHGSTKTTDDYKKEVSRHIKYAIAALNNRGDRGIIEGTAEEIVED